MQQEILQESQNYSPGFSFNEKSAQQPLPIEDAAFTDQFLREKDPVKVLIKWLNKKHKTTSIQNLKSVLTKTIVHIDNIINAQVNAILHHQQFQKLEASWRGIFYLTDQSDLYDKENKVKLRILDCSWETLGKDLNRAIEFDQSELFKLIYRNEFDMPGGEPFGIIVGDYQIHHKNRVGVGYNDIDILKEISRAASAAFTPFITSCTPSFLGVDNFTELGSVINIRDHFEQNEYKNWQSLRAMEESRFLGITMPQVLMRSPYKDDETRAEPFAFREKIADSENDYLWGNAAYAFGAIVIRAFCQHRWFGQIRGMKKGQLNRGVVTDLPYSRYETEQYQENNKPSVNLLIGDLAEKALSDSGIIPLSAVPYTDYPVFFSNASVYLSKDYNSLPAKINAKLSSMLQYMLCVSRFAHHIKIIMRDKVGSFQTAQDCENHLRNWLHKYTTSSDIASDEVRSKFPLNDAQIKVSEIKSKPGHYYSIIHLQPHYQLDQISSSIKLVTEFTPTNS